MQHLPITQVCDVVATAEAVVGPDAPLLLVRRRLEASPGSSLIVVSGGRPVGIVCWSDLVAQPPDTPIQAVMHRAFPPLRPELSAALAQSWTRTWPRTAPVQVDPLPVIDAGGRLVGQVPRRLLSKRERVTTSVTGRVIGGQGALADGHLVHLERGMPAHALDGTRLGTIGEIGLSLEGRIAHLTLRSGRGGCRTWLPADLLQRVAVDAVTLNLTPAEFRRLRASRIRRRAVGTNSYRGSRYQSVASAHHVEDHP